jgi:hypothetical protein
LGSVNDLPGGRGFSFRPMSGLRPDLNQRGVNVRLGAAKVGLSPGTCFPVARIESKERPMCDTVPLSVLALDLDPPVSGWKSLFEAEGVDVVEDGIGRTAISSEDAARLIGARRAAYAFAEDLRRRREAEMVVPAVPRGLPAVEGMTALEQMLLAGEADREPSVRTQLLDEELARGRR